MDELRRYAIASSLFPATSLGRAIGKLGFVQADPIRSPARAQDLILRHRVKDYREGDLERKYRILRLEEDFVYAYGFMPPATWRLLHPRTARALTAGEASVLEIVSSRKQVHPRELEVPLGREREMNAWGGYSKATTRALERLHHLGLVRIAGRDRGIKLYAPVKHSHEPETPLERLRQLTLLIIKILTPISVPSLRATLVHLRRVSPQLPWDSGALENLTSEGGLSSGEVDGVRYLWPAGRLKREEPDDVIRFLAPFDPLVWDRKRFEHFWGWRYRFEAYTPPSKRKLGYYALPMLWRTSVVGWVNISRQGQAIEIEPGFVSGTKPVDRAFRRAFEAEESRMRRFLLD